VIFDRSDINKQYSNVLLVHYLDKARLVSGKWSGEASIPGPYDLVTSVHHIVGSCHLLPQKIRLSSVLNDLEVGGERLLNFSI
jgi:hypothetical protein